MSAPPSQRGGDDRFDLLARATNDVIYDWDVVTGVVHWNEAMAVLFGFDPADPQVSSLAFWSGTIHPDDRERVLSQLDGLIAHGPDLVQLEYRFRRIDGSYAHVLDRGYIQRDESGKALRMVGAMFDLTERRLMEARLRLADRMVSVGTLAAGVAHEINNPLTFVIANLEVIARDLGRIGDDLGRSDLGTAQQRLAQLGEVLGNAREGAERVRRIVRDLRTFSRVDEEHSGPVDLRTVIESALAMAHNEVVHRARVIRRFEQVPPVMGNEARLGQVVLNLIINAAQALPEGQADRNEIRIALRRATPVTAVLEVSDTGPGIPQEMLGRIFDPFFTTKPVGVGTGLGLTIVHGIVSALGGLIEVDSRVGQGTTFRVHLPASDREATRSSDLIEAEPAPAGPAARVLVIDDEAAIGRAIALALDRHEVVVMTRASDALARIRDGEKFDVILCDVMMPETSGMDFYDELGTVAPDAQRRVVFLTGGAFTERARRFLERVPNERLDKPFTAAKLAAAVDRTTRRT